MLVKDLEKDLDQARVTLENAGIMSDGGPTLAEALHTLRVNFA